MIFKKHLIDVSLRIQCIIRRSWPYIFTSDWIKGKDNSVADGLSRVTRTPMEYLGSRIDLPIVQVNILSALMVQEICELQQETESDGELQQVMKAICNGRPSQLSQTIPTLHSYWNFRDELCIENGILFKNNKILVPKMLQKKYLDKIHKGHQGIQQSLQEAREYAFLNNYIYVWYIKETVEKCFICQENSTVLHTEKFKYVSTIPSHPWHTLGVDLLGLLQEARLHGPSWLLQQISHHQEIA